MDVKRIYINKDINDNEYLNSDIEEVIISHNVKKIGNRAFAFARKLKKITFKCEEIELGYECFIGCKNLKTIKLPKMSYIPYRCFFNSGLVDVKFPNNLIGVDSEAFCGCKLKVLNFPNSLKTIGSFAFANGGNLITIDFKNVEFLADHSFCYTEINHLKIGGIIEVIPYMCFANCDLKYVEILKTVDRGITYEYKRNIINLDRYSFANNPYMTIKLPESVNGYEETFWINDNPYFKVYIKEPYKNMKILLPNDYLKFLGGSEVIYYARKNIKIEGY